MPFPHLSPGFMSCAAFVFGLLVSGVAGLCLHVILRRTKPDERLRHLLDGAPIGILSVDTLGRITEANSAIERLFDFSRAELLGEPVWSIIPKAHLEPSAALQVFAVRRDGTRFLVEFGFTPAHEGRRRSGTVFVRDLSRQNAAREALVASNEKLSLILQMLPGFVWSERAGGELDYLNQQGPYLDALGAEAPFDWNSMVHPDDVALKRHALEEMMQTGEPCEYEFRLLGDDGTYRWYQARTDALHDGRGTVVRCYGLAWDIDTRKRVEAALEANERELRLMVETIPGMVTVNDGKGQLEYANKRLLDFVGRSFQQLYDRGWPILHPDDMEKDAGEWRRCVEAGAPMEATYRLRRYDGEYRWFEVRVQPLHDERGDVARWYGLFVDVDDRRKAEEALRTAQSRISRATKIATVAELSASIAHEVNQPLAAIVTNGHACQSWLSSDPPNLERARQAAERVVRDGNSAADVVSRIRALFRQTAPSKAALDLNVLVSEVLRLFEDDLARKSITVMSELLYPLPHVWADGPQIQQIIINLINNAIEAMEGVGLSQRQITVRTWPGPDQRACVQVSDGGRGVEDVERIFEPFFSTKESGMGMGLSICRSIVEAHGGQLWASSRQPHGTALEFFIPLEVHG
ncbi:PAS domain S-box protein [Caballeronia sp. LjRoot34]|uniref:PAS domain-containing sensor histidine kinase n=1 Tax=Caballeronia sp. LjRoot34 TaxID=3342325 RepID=UPI003ECDE5E6